MPVISVTMGTINKEQKKALIAGLTATAIEITNIPPHAFNVTINELSDENLGLGGQTVEEIKQGNV
jgi:4-oxalocrotonate tautomerase